MPLRHSMSENRSSSQPILMMFFFKDFGQTLTEVPDLTAGPRPYPLVQRLRRGANQYRLFVTRRGDQAVSFSCAWMPS